jgi:hypothetical protein
MRRAPAGECAGCRAALLALACAALAACASAPIVPGEPKVVENLTLTPYDQREECMRLRAGDRVDYQFLASRPVGFSIDYRDGNAIVAPVDLAPQRSDSGVFVARIAREHCLTWQAGPGGAYLDYRVLLRRAEP